MVTICFILLQDYNVLPPSLSHFYFQDLALAPPPSHPIIFTLIYSWKIRAVPRMCILNYDRYHFYAYVAITDAGTLINNMHTPGWNLF
jgi:hypothetical protein